MSTIETTTFAKLRRERGLTQSELADYLGVSQGYICMIERGQRRLLPHLAVRAGRALGISGRALLEVHEREVRQREP